jgi:hypothetical protein
MNRRNPIAKNDTKSTERFSIANTTRPGTTKNGSRNMNRKQYSSLNQNKPFPRDPSGAPPSLQQIKDMAAANYNYASGTGLISGTQARRSTAEQAKAALRN